MKKRGLLVVNVGTPKSPSPEDVGIYLTHFLMDPYIIELPGPLRWLLVNLVIVPRRRHASAALYKKIWTKRGSPLLVNTLDLIQGLKLDLGSDWAVEPAMCVGTPSIEEGLLALQAAAVEELVVSPQYPQFANATYGSAESLVRKTLSRIAWKPHLRFVPPFSRETSFLNASADILKKHIFGILTPKVLFSFHGLPKKNATASEYRDQCVKTAENVAKLAGLRRDQWETSFQSRLGRGRWLGPYTDDKVRQLARDGVRELFVMAPSFTADCLETLEELEIRGSRIFKDSGGEKFHLVPCLNGRSDWLSEIVRSVTR